MIRGGKTCWKAVKVHGLRLHGGPTPTAGACGRDELRELTASERLAALYRFQNGEVSSDHCFVRLEGRACVEVADPAEIDWETFPILAALEAITRDELRRLRHILRADNDGSYALAEEEPLPPTSSGTWALPVFGKSASSSEA